MVVVGLITMHNAPLFVLYIRLHTNKFLLPHPAVCPISFNQEQYYVPENVQGGEVEVCLEVERNCFGDFSVILQTKNGSAKGQFTCLVV